MQILDHGIQIEALELFCVIEVFLHRIGQSGVLMQDGQVQLMWPPGEIPLDALRSGGDSAMHGRFCLSALRCPGCVSAMNDRAFYIG